MATPDWFTIVELHPALVHFPIAFLLGGEALDLWAWHRPREDLFRMATGLLAAGLIAGTLAALAGALAYFIVSAHTERAHALMTWHWLLQATALVLFAWRLLGHRRPWTGPPGALLRGVGLTGSLVLVVGSFVGGVMVYHGGAGIAPAILDPSIRDGHYHGNDDGHHGGGEHHHQAGTDDGGRGHRHEADEHRHDGASKDGSDDEGVLY